MVIISATELVTAGTSASRHCAADPLNNWTAIWAAAADPMRIKSAAKTPAARASRYDERVTGLERINCRVPEENSGPMSCAARIIATMLMIP